jgi:hypothetical protein
MICKKTNTVDREGGVMSDGLPPIPSEIKAKIEQDELVYGNAFVMLADGEWKRLDPKEVILSHSNSAVRSLVRRDMVLHFIKKQGEIGAQDLRSLLHEIGFETESEVFRSMMNRLVDRNDNIEVIGQRKDKVFRWLANE